MGKKKKRSEQKTKVLDISMDIKNIKPDVELKEIFRERSINNKIIPSACNLRMVLLHLRDNSWNISKLKKYERGCYNSYKLDEVIKLLKNYDEEYWPEILRLNVLSIYGNDIGANCASVYLVGYVAEKMGPGEEMVQEYCKLSGITDKELSMKAIYNTGKGDGEYLGILNENGAISDWDFFEKWVMG